MWGASHSKPAPWRAALCYPESGRAQDGPRLELRMGTYRLLLAYCVVIEHVATGYQALSHTGMFAVEGFYVLSGFLITKILNEVYHFEWQSFWINRFLRLYPQYLLLLAFGSLLLAVSPSTAAFFPAV